MSAAAGEVSTFFSFKSELSKDQLNTIKDRLAFDNNDKTTTVLNWEACTVGGFGKAIIAAASKYTGIGSACQQLVFTTEPLRPIYYQDKQLQIPNVFNISGDLKYLITSYGGNLVVGSSAGGARRRRKTNRKQSKRRSTHRRRRHH